MPGVSIPTIVAPGKLRQFSELKNTVGYLTLNQKRKVERREGKKEGEKE